MLGHLEIVEALIAAKADVNAQNNEGSTALMWATDMRALPILRALLKAKPDVNVKNKKGVTALMVAAARPQYSAPIEQELLLEPKIEVNAKDNEGLTALTVAWEFGSEEVVPLLKNAGGIGEMRPKMPDKKTMKGLINP